MARAKKPSPEIVDDDLGVASFSDGVQQTGGGSPPQEQSSGVVAAADLFSGGRESGGSVEEWRSRRDAWDHGVYNHEFHLGEDRFNADGKYKVRRAPGGKSSGGQKGAKKDGTTEARPLPISTIELGLKTFHHVVASITKAPELKLDDDDANNLAVPLKKISDLQGVKVDPRIEPYMMLMLACVHVYGPKFHDIGERMKAQRARNVTPKGGQAVATRPAAGPQASHKVNPGANGAAPPTSQDAGPDIVKPMSQEDILKTFGEP